MKLLLVIGTRPEAIKMAPLIRRLQTEKNISFEICNTGQHKDLLDPVLEFFGINVNHNLNIMLPNQSLHQITASIITNIKPIIETYMPDYVLVHGDTTTSFASALAAFYSGTKIAHIEAGLRTFDKYAPFPEEINRSLTARLADVHFAPTNSSESNLLKENVTSNIIVTGNTVIDALLDAVDLVNEASPEIVLLKSKLININKKIILFTGHRRENFGDGFESIFSALTKLTSQRNDIVVVYPVHPNPNVKLLAEKHFKHNPNVLLIDPLSYGPFVWLLQKTYIILTDSGGIQEEAPSLGKPVLVLREVTERPEAVDAGTVILVGTDTEKMISITNNLLDDKNLYTRMSELNNPYGDGKASDRIINFFIDKLQKN